MLILKPRNYDVFINYTACDCRIVSMVYAKIKIV